MKMKRCPVCKQELPATQEFWNICRTRVDGLFWRCKKCHSERRKIERSTTESREKRKAYFREWIKKYPEKHTKHNMEWEKKNPEKANAIARRAYHKHIEESRKNARINSANRRAKVKEVGGKHTKSDITRMLINQKDRCYYCQKKLNGVYNVDHVIPISRGGSNDPSNLVIACPQCNKKKSYKMPHEWTEGGKLF